MKHVPWNISRCFCANRAQWPHYVGNAGFKGKQVSALWSCPGVQQAAFHCEPLKMQWVIILSEGEFELWNFGEGSAWRFPFKLREGRPVSEDLGRGKRLSKWKWGGVSLWRPLVKVLRQGWIPGIWVDGDGCSLSNRNHGLKGEWWYTEGVQFWTRIDRHVTCGV